MIVDATDILAVTSTPVTERVRFSTREQVPEAQRLVAGAGDDALSIWGHGKVDDPRGMSSERGNLVHRRVLPHDNLVERVAMRGNHFIHTGGPHEIANL